VRRILWQPGEPGLARAHVTGELDVEFVLSCGSPAGLAAIFAPVLMTFLLAAGSGKPTTEERLAARPGYAEYVARTSGFIPRRPRAGAPGS
jgi:steroid 5-alpha reductase family enzyme